MPPSSKAKNGNRPVLAIMAMVGCCALTSFPWAPHFTNIQPQTISHPLLLRSLLLPVSITSFDGHINDAARKNHLDPLLLKAIIWVDSGFDPHSLSAAGACGLTQLMPSTAKLFGIHNIYDPKENIEGGAHHFRNLLERFSHNLPLSLAAYNAGEVPIMQFHGIPPIRKPKGTSGKFWRSINPTR